MSPNLKLQGMPRERERRILGAVAVVLFLLPASWLILRGHGRGSNYADQQEFHLPTIVRYAQQWPHPDLKEHGSAQTPGYHIFLAAVARFLGRDARILQGVGALITAGFLLTFFLALAVRTDPRLAFLLTLPLISSVYVFQAGVWIMTDNPALWGVAGMLILVLRKRLDTLTFLGGAVLLAVLVSIRQNSLWTAALLWTAAFLGPREPSVIPAVGYKLSGVITKNSRRWMMAAAAAMVPAVIILSYFIVLWEGFTPPRFGAHFVLTPVGPAFFLTLFAIYGLFFLPFIWDEILGLLKTRPRSLWIVLSAGEALALIPVSTYSRDSHRYGGLWNFLPNFPSPGGRSLVILLLAPLGALLILAWIKACQARRLRRELIILSAGVVAFLVAHLVSYAYQRYYEPFILIILSLSAATISFEPSPSAEIPDGDSRNISPWLSAGRKIGPIALFIFLAALSWLTLK